MPKIESAFYNVGYLDRLSYLDTPVHRLDPRAKLVTTLVFIIVIVSMGKYEITMLLPFFFFPVFVASLGGIPFGFLARKIIIMAPFAVMVGMFNPFLDRDILIHAGSMGISGGWVSFISIIIRFILTISAAFILISTTGFMGICLALEKLKVPKIFAVQLLFLYRYIFVLIEEAGRLVTARDLRSFHGRGMGIRVTGLMIGHLLLRTIDRARRIHLSMLCRGFDGNIYIMRSLRFRFYDIAYIALWASVFFIFRFYNVPGILGRLTGGIFA